MPLRFFISHRHEDQHLAAVIKGHLEHLGDGQAQAMVSETIPGGEEWERWIGARAVDTDVLLLLYTTADHDWSWCIREVGLFEGAKLRDGKKPFVTGFVGEGLEVPAVVARYQFYRSSPAEIERFLRDAFERGEFSGGVPLVPNIIGRKGSDLRQARDAIAAEMRRLIQPEEYFHRRIVIRLPEIEELDPSGSGFVTLPAAQQVEAMLRQARIEGRHGTLGFLLVDQGASWAQLRRAQDEIETVEWLGDVTAYLAASLPGADPEARDGRQQILTPFSRAATHYLPVISRVEYSSGWPTALIVIFVKMPPLSESPHTMRKQGIPHDVVYLATLDRLSRLFRWGFIEAIARQAAMLAHKDRPNDPRWPVFERHVVEARKVLEFVERQGSAIKEIQDPESTREAINLSVTEVMERLWSRHDERKATLLEAIAGRDLATVQATIQAWQADTKDFMLAINARLREEIEALEPRLPATNVRELPRLQAN